MTSPAPESEKATWPNGTEQRKYGDCYQCGFPRHQHLEGKKCPPKETEYQSKRAPASCSEVVERLAPFSNHSGSLNSADSASGTEGTRATKEIREWLEWKSEHAQKRISELDGLGRPHIPLDSQLNGYLQGERDCAIDALKQLDNQSKRQRINGDAHGE